jgi:hypothetical protein
LLSMLDTWISPRARAKKISRGISSLTHKLRG